MTCRAERNNNPGNIDRGANWRGLQPPEAMTPAQEAEHRFCVFSSPAYGFRAMALILSNYEQDGIDTIDGAISRWAPPGENNTEAYIKFVVADTDIGANDPIDLRNGTTAAKVITAIAKHESGIKWWQDSDVVSGLALAGIRV